MICQLDFAGLLLIYLSPMTSKWLKHTLLWLAFLDRKLRNGITIRV